jgi:hypothetical protein
MRFPHRDDRNDMTLRKSHINERHHGLLAGAVPFVPVENTGFT